MNSTPDPLFRPLPRWVVAVVLTCAFLMAGAILCYGTERVLVSENRLPPQLDDLLADGWTVKHQSVACHAGKVNATPASTIYLFTLIAPPDWEQRQEQRLAAKRAEFARKRAEYLAKQPQVEKK